MPRRSARRWLLRLIVVGAVAAVGLGLAISRRAEDSPNQEIEAAVAERDFNRARELLQSRLRDEPENATAVLQLARTERHLENLPAARGHIDRARELGADRDDVEREELLFLAQSGHLDRAEEHLPRLLRERDDPGEVYEAYVVGYFRHLRLDAAKRLLDEWQEQSPDDPGPHLLFAAMWGHLEKWEQAENAARDALRRAPDLEIAHFRLAGALYRQSRYREAAAQYEHCLGDSPHRAEAQAALADCLFNLGENERAKATFEQVLADNPAHFSAQLGMGRLTLSDGRTEDALKWLTPAAAARPYDLAARYHLAIALKETGRADAAQEHFAHVQAAQGQLDRYALLSDLVAREPDNLEARHELGVIVLRFFEPAKGVRWLESVLQRNPRHAATHRVLADYFEREGAADRARYHRQMAARQEETGHGT